MSSQHLRVRAVTIGVPALQSLVGLHGSEQRLTLGDVLDLALVTKTLSEPPPS